MADVTVPLYQGQPGTGDTLLYTNGTGAPAVIKSITVVNTTGSAATLTLGANAAAALAAANYIIPAISFAANSVASFELWKVLVNGGTIRALQGTSTAITVHIDGITQ